MSYFILWQQGPASLIFAANTVICSTAKYMPDITITKYYFPTIKLAGPCSHNFPTIIISQKMLSTYGKQQFWECISDNILSIYSVKLFVSLVLILLLNYFLPTLSSF